MTTANLQPQRHASPTQPSQAGQVRQHLERLEATLRQSVERHGQLLDLMQRKRVAMREGNTDRLTDLTRAENAHVQTISELEKSRLQRVADLTLALDPTATQPLKLAPLAEKFPEPVRGRLLVMRQQLLDAMQAVQAETAVAKRAAESLVKHVNGLVRTLANVSHGNNAYTPAGRTPAQPARLSTLSLTA